MRRVRSFLRSEGLTEYVIITFVIMVCALVSFFSMVQNIRDIADDLELCIECDPKDKDKNGSKTTEDGTTKPQVEDTREWWEKWLDDFRRWFKYGSGAPYWYTDPAPEPDPNTGIADVDPAFDPSLTEEECVT